MHDDFLKKAIRLASEEGLHTLNRERLCAALGVSPGSFAHVTGVSYTTFLREVAYRLPLDHMRGGAARMDSAIRRRQVLAHAIDLARKFGYSRITAEQVADAAGICRANLARVYSMPELRGEVVRHAVNTRDKQLLQQARDNNDPLI